MLGIKRISLSNALEASFSANITKSCACQIAENQKNNNLYKGSGEPLNKFFLKASEALINE